MPQKYSRQPPAALTIPNSSKHCWNMFRAGALSVELFRMDIVNRDPFAVATEIRSKCEAVMREAEVL